MTVSDIRSRTAQRTALPGRRCAPLNAETCPDAAMLTTFCEGRLATRDRESIASHLVGCERCYFAVTESMRISLECTGHGRQRSRWLWRGLAWAAGLVLTTGVLTSLADRRSASQPPGAISTAEAARPQVGPGAPDDQPNAARPDGGEPGYSAAPASDVSAADRPTRDKRAVLSAATYDLRGLRPQNLQVTTKPEPTLDEAAGARAQSALAGVLLARWRDTKHLEDAVAAFEAAKRALAAAPQLPEARYNMASALEAMSTSFQHEARNAWEEYLTVDLTSSRAKEVRRHLETYKGPDGASQIAGLHRFGATERDK
jgi:hypothetical protein